ncbi:SUI1 family translation initiation factor, partial [Streptomyces fildesensis]|uniref:SUI1 family translation initiation factor n=1 Tax=Streptomyces fildesensis TaxID=375757 RepID=UPI0018E01D05
MSHTDIQSELLDSINSLKETEEYVHIRVQQRNGKKSLTTVQGLSAQYSIADIMKDLRKQLCCNGTAVAHPEMGKVIQLQGDQRKR